MHLFTDIEQYRGITGSLPDNAHTVALRREKFYIPLAIIARHLGNESSAYATDNRTVRTQITEEKIHLKPYNKQNGHAKTNNILQD